MVPLAARLKDGRKTDAEDVVCRNEFWLFSQTKRTSDLLPFVKMLSYFRTTTNSGDAFKKGECFPRALLQQQIHPNPGLQTPFP